MDIKTIRDVEDESMIQHVGEMSEKILEKKIDMLKKVRFYATSQIEFLMIKLGKKRYGRMSMGEIEAEWNRKSTSERLKMANMVNGFREWLYDLGDENSDGRIREIVLEAHFDDTNEFGLKASEFFENVCKKE